MALHQGLWVARKFAPEDAVYFPHELDFRGRVYPIPVFGPSPQGSDFQKALIEFADGMPLGEEGRRWLLIHIANLLDRKSVVSGKSVSVSVDLGGRRIIKKKK